MGVGVRVRLGSAFTRRVCSVRAASGTVLSAYLVKGRVRIRLRVRDRVRVSVCSEAHLPRSHLPIYLRHTSHISPPYLPISPLPLESVLRGADVAPPQMYRHPHLVRVRVRVRVSPNPNL